MPSHLHYVPVFQFDPNTPSRPVNGVSTVVVGVRDPDMTDDFRNGMFKPGDLAFAYQPNETPDSGVGFPCRIIKWVDVDARHERGVPTEYTPMLLVYLENDPAYSIIDTRRSAEENDIERQNDIFTLEEPPD